MCSNRSWATVLTTASSEPRPGGGLEDRRVNCGVALSCRVLLIALATFCDHFAKRVHLPRLSARIKRDEELKSGIARVFEKSLRLWRPSDLASDVDDYCDNALGETTTGCSRQRSFTTAGDYAALKPSNISPSKGFSGSIRDVFWNPSVISRQLRLIFNPPVMDKSASGKPGAGGFRSVQSIGFVEILVDF